MLLFLRLKHLERYFQYKGELFPHCQRCSSLCRHQLAFVTYEFALFPLNVICSLLHTEISFLSKTICVTQNNYKYSSIHEIQLVFE